MSLLKKELYMKYFVIKMKQKFDLDLIGAKILETIPYGLKEHYIVKFEDIVQIFLDSMIDEK